MPRGLIVGVNDVATVRPDLVVEALFDATAVHSGSHSKMRWRCNAGHEYEAIVKGRVAGSGCPICSNKTVLAGFNDLATLRPDLALEATFDATKVTPGSSKKLGWRCSLGHEWVTAVSERSSGKGCPYCAGNRVLAGFNDLATTRPDLALQANFDATTVTAGSNRQLPWRCSEGHTWEASPHQRLNGSGCAVCAKRGLHVGITDLATTHPEVASQALFDSAQVSAGSHRKFSWRCEKGHEWEAEVASRTTGRGCPFCAGNRVLTGFNDLETLFPIVASEARFNPKLVNAYAKKKLPWRCAKGHEWEAQVSSRTSRGSGCPYCSSRLLAVGETDLATLFPELALEALFDPKSVSAFSSASKKWRCSKGHEWTAKVASRSRGTGCPYCSGNKVLPGFNDLATTDPELSREALFDPTTVGRGSGKKLPWRCSLGHEWEAVVSNRAGNSAGCIFCTGRKALPGFNDLASQYPDLAREAMFDATQVTTGSRKKLPWRCAEMHEWMAPVQDRVQGHGCPNCAKFGFNPEEPAWLYLLIHRERDMIQIGITNNVPRRMREHRKNGWEALDLRGPMDGLLAQNLERDLLSFLQLGKKVTLSPSSTSRKKYRGKPGKKGEAWCADEYQVSQIGTLIDECNVWQEKRND
jgi:hypothetical protein